MKSYSLTLFLWCFAFVYVVANGDPTTTWSALTRSANPSPKPIVDIQILREDLYIEPGQNTKVKVKYTLLNTSGKDYENIDYGFPVDYRGAGMNNAQMVDNLFSESTYNVGWHDFYIKSMAFSMNGNTLPYTLSEETVVERVDREAFKEEYLEFVQPDSIVSINDEVENYALESDIARRWFYTKFSIKANQTCILEVEYTLRNSFRTPLYDTNYIYSSSESGNGQGLLYYDMSPAQHWGDGTAKELSIVIDYTNTLSQKDQGLYSYIETLGLPFIEEGQKMIYSAKNFNFKDSKPIELNYYATYYNKYNDLIRYRISPSTYTLTASDELEAYPVSNMSDLDFSTAWAIKSNDIQDKKLKIVFDKPTVVGAILLVGGYHKSVSTYKNNAQPKTIEVSLDDDWSQSYSLDTDKIAQYQGISDDNVLDYSIIFTQPKYSEYEKKPIKEITISLEDIYSGDKFDDLCISEIILLSPDYSMDNYR